MNTQKYYNCKNIFGQGNISDGSRINICRLRHFDDLKINFLVLLKNFFILDNDIYVRINMHDFFNTFF